MDAASSTGTISFRNTSGESARPAENSGKLTRLMLVVMLCALAGGATVAMADVSGLVLCLTVIATLLVMRDFRVGVVLLIMMMPIGASQIFPRSMLGVTGLNPVNLLMVATLASFMIRGHMSGALARLAPRSLVWTFCDVRNSTPRFSSMATVAITSGVPKPMRCRCSSDAA